MAHRKRERLARTRELLAECEVVPEELLECLGRLKKFLAPFSGFFGRSEMREHGEDFVRGLLSDLERKSVEPIAERAGKHRRGMQRFIGAGGWDHRPVTEELCRQVGGEIGTPEGIIVLDPSAFIKKGYDSVGVSRQWCGRTGQIENCQLGVFMGYVSEQGHTLVDMRLFLPKGWIADSDGREKCRVPEGLEYRTTRELGLEMILERRRHLPHAWIVGDDEFGYDSDFRAKLHSLGERYVLDVPGRVAVYDPETTTGGRSLKTAPWLHAAQWAQSLPEQEWARIVVRGGSKGPLVLHAVRKRVRARWRRQLAHHVEWLLVVRTEAQVPEYRYYLCNAEECVGVEAMVRAASSRFWIEDCFERAKGEVGLADYETRSWEGWYHHMALALLALWFLVEEQRRLKQSTPAITLQQSKAAISELLRNPDLDARTLAQRITRRLERNEQSRIAHWARAGLLAPPNLSRAQE